VVKKQSGTLLLKRGLQGKEGYVLSVKKALVKKERDEQLERQTLL